MSIIYSYPEQGQLNADDMFIGTSAVTVGGKQKNITRNFTVQQIADFINQGAGFVDPLASDFQIPVFNQEGKKITGSIMSQNIYPNGSAITIAGQLTVNSNLTASGNVTLGSGANNIILQSTTTLGGPIKDSSNTLGVSNQILISNSLGNLVWQNYEAGLTYEGTWDASTNTPALTSGQGVSGHFYIVSVAGNTNLDGNNDWHIGDWAVFFDAGGGGTAGWQKIDNTSVLTGNGTANTFAMWTATETLNDSILTQDVGATKIQVAGGIDTAGVIQPSTTNANLQIQGNGTGGVEVKGAGGNDGKIQLNCSANSHGVTLQSPPHSAGATYTLVLPTSTGTAGQILTTAGGSSSQLTWTTPLGNVIQAVSGPLTSGNIPIANGAYSVTDSIMSYAGTVISVNGDFSTQGLEVNKYLTDGTGSNGTDGQVLTSTTSGGDKEILWVDSSTIGDTYDLGSGASGVSNSIELQLTSGSGTDNSAITLTGGTGITVAQAGDVVTLTGSAQGVTSVTGDSTTIAATSGNTPVISAITTGGVSSGSTSLATGAQIQTAIDSALAGAVTFKGTFNANTGSITGTSDFLYNPGANTNTVPIAIGDMYIVSTAGNFYGNTALNVGDEVIAIAAAPISGSAEAGWNAVPSAGAGVTSVLPSSTGLASTGQPLVITPAAGTGSVTIESTAYAGGSNVGHVPAGGLGGQYLDGATGSWSTLPAGYTSWTASSDQNTNIIVTDTTNLPFTGRLASDGAYSASANDAGIYTDTAINTGEVTIGLINNGGTPSATTFYRGDGQWAQAGGGTITKQLFTVTTAQSIFTLTAGVNPADANYVNIFIDGVYQNSGTYTVATATGTTTVTLNTDAPAGTSVEIISTT